jgi:hypothetical protein
MEKPQPKPEFMEVFDPNRIEDVVPIVPQDLEPGGIAIIFPKSHEVIPARLNSSDALLGAVALARSHSVRLPRIPPLQ